MKAVLRLEESVRKQFGIDLGVKSWKGASQSDLASFDRRFPNAPDQLRELLLLRNGDHDSAVIAPYRFLNTTAIAEKFDHQISIYEDLAAALSDTATFFDTTVDGRSSPVLCKCSETWSRFWIPIADNDADVVFVDLDPGPCGTKGQVVYAYADEMSLVVLGCSIGDWFNRVANAVDSNLFDEYLVTTSDLMRAFPLV